MAGFARELGALPRAGGILDQDYYHIQLLRAGLYALNKKAEYDDKMNKGKSRGG